MEYPKEATWHWLTPDGQESHGTLSDLRARLLTHSLPASTWVWSTTWTEWLPATRVAELASALQPGARRPLKKPKRDPNAQTPPAQRPNDEMSRVSPAPGAPREAMATLGEDAQFTHSNTLRPPGAVPPPPRAVPQLIKHDASSIPSSPKAIATPIPGVLVAGQRDAAETLASTPQPNERSALAERMSRRPDTLQELVRSSPNAGDSPASKAAAPRISAARGAAATKAVDASAPTAAKAPVGAGEAKGSARTALLVLSFACAALTLGLGLALHALSQRPPAGLTQASNAAKAAALASPATGCTLLVPPAKLAGSVERSVEPYFLGMSGERVAVGFAATRTQAAGLVLNLATLDQSAVFDEAGERALLGVVPIRAEPLAFAADRESGELGSPHSLDGNPGAALGFVRRGLATRVGDEPANLVWPTPDVPRTEPRVARVGERHAVVFRQGGQAGSLFVGWLDAKLHALGDLSPIEGCPRLLGTPALGARANTAVAAFAARDNEQEPWRVRLARLSPEKPPRVSAEFSHPQDGAGNGAIAPTLTALGREHWALQWTQGKSGQYRVAVQALGADFAPLGAPVPSSPKGASAGQGSIWVTGERALSLYVLTVGGRDELWGTVLQCR